MKTSWARSSSLLRILSSCLRVSSSRSSGRVEAAEEDEESGSADVSAAPDSPPPAPPALAERGGRDRPRRSRPGAAAGLQRAGGAGRARSEASWKAPAARPAPSKKKSEGRRPSQASLDGGDEKEGGPRRMQRAIMATMMLEEDLPEEGAAKGPAKNWWRAQKGM
jgi:hypothetical protein